MTNIIIYTTEEKLEQKKDKDCSIAYWTLNGYPKKFEQGEDLVFFAYDGHIQGHFDSDVPTIHSGEDIPVNSVKFCPWSWQELKNKISAKPFQGFKYADKVPELTKIIEQYRRD